MSTQKGHNHKYSFGKPMVHGCPACEQTEQETRNRLMPSHRPKNRGNNDGPENKGSTYKGI